MHARRHQNKVTIRNRLTVCILCLFLFLGFGWGTLAIDPSRDLSQFNRRVWLTENGLPQNTVHSIVQTKDGYVWIATEEGLARFDGLKFTVFDKQNTPALKSNDIRVLVADRQGALWIGTADGLVRLVDGKFTAFTTQDGWNTSLLQMMKRWQRFKRFRNLRESSLHSSRPMRSHTRFRSRANWERTVALL